MGYEFFLYVIIFIVILVCFIRELRFLIRTRTCTVWMRGTVESLWESCRSRHGSRFTVIVTYECTDSAGETHRYRQESFHSYRYDTFYPGCPVDISIDPQYPELMILTRERTDAVKELLLCLVVCVPFFAAVCIATL